MKLHIWTDEVSYLAVCHAETVAEARELLKVEVGYNDGSCPEREKAWRHITGNTSAPYNGRVAAFCLSGSSEVREQLAYSEKVVSERDSLRAELAAARLEIEALRVKPWQEQIEGQSAVISRLRYEKGVAEAEATALKAHVERMKNAFKRIMTTDENGKSMTWPQIDEMVRPLLAATPSQSLAKLMAETLWAAAMKISDSGPYGWDDAVDWLTSEAERLQEKAANG